MLERIKDIVESFRRIQRDGGGMYFGSELGPLNWAVKITRWPVAPPRFTLDICVNLK